MQLAGGLSHPGRLPSMNMRTCVNQILKLKSVIFPFPVGSATCRIHPHCWILATKRSKHIGAAKFDRQVPGAPWSPATTLGPGRAEEHFVASIKWGNRSDRGLVGGYTHHFRFCYQSQSQAIWHLQRNLTEGTRTMSPVKNCGHLRGSQAEADDFSWMTDIQGWQLHRLESCHSAGSQWLVGSRNFGRVLTGEEIAFAPI